MSRQAESTDESALRGRCGFCAAVLPPDAEVCPECGHAVSEGLQAHPRRPVWVSVLAVVLLALALLGLAAWAVHLVRSVTEGG